jgi:hypothetical protein
MDDRQIHHIIERLVAEEEALWRLESEGDAGAAEQQRLREVTVALDQCWDLLHQRRALREANLDPDASALRPAEVVERYQQ